MRYLSERSGHYLSLTDTINLNNLLLKMIEAQRNDLKVEYYFQKDTKIKLDEEHRGKHRCGDTWYDSPNDCPACNQ